MREDILCQIERYYQMVMQEDRKDQPFALIVDGKALEIALSDDIKDQFLKLAVRCDSAICCRVSPKQKALVCHCFLCLGQPNAFFSYSCFNTQFYISF